MSRAARGGVPGRVPGGASDVFPAVFPKRPWTPLALSLGLHLLLVLAWRGATQPKPIATRPPHAPAFVLVQPLASPELSHEARRAASERPRPHKPAAAATVAPPPPVTPRLRSEPEPVGQAPADEDASAHASASASASEPAPGPASAPGDLLATSKAMAGSVDRALRNGSSPITAEPDRKWERFAQAFAAARKDGGNTVTLDSYTAPDGVITYRKTVGGRVSCYRSGSAGGPATVFGRPLDNQGAGNVPCPTGVRWTRQ
ncbi:hypothetical protein [Massilia sp. GCM10023247]|uniref:hypothetical protein n=1 Tax=Massilia sp. GCM10023247 TaxID=3252643 RepID=UPI003605CE65